MSFGHINLLKVKTRIYDQESKIRKNNNNNKKKEKKKRVATCNPFKSRSDYIKPKILYSFNSISHIF